MRLNDQAFLWHRAQSLVLGAGTVGLCLLLSVAVWAKTPAGTQISHTATLTYDDGSGELRTQSSNTVTIVVSQVAGVEMQSDIGGTLFGKPGEPVFYPVTLTNTGNDKDTFSFDTIDLPSGWTSTVYLDQNGDGILDDAEKTELTELGPVNPEEQRHVIVTVTPGDSAADGTEGNVEFQAASHNDPNIVQGVKLTATVNDVDVTLSAVADQGTAHPGDVLTYTVTLDNTSSGTAKSLVAKVPIPSGATYVRGTATLDGSLLTDEDDTDQADGDSGRFSDVDKELVITEDRLPAGNKKAITFQVRVNNVVPGTQLGGTVTLDYRDTAGSGRAVSIDYSSVQVSVWHALHVMPDKPSVSVIPGDTLLVPFTLTNNGNVTNEAKITFVTQQKSLSWKLFEDPNGNGELDETELESAKGPYTLPAAGTHHFVARLVVPAGTADGTVDELRLIAVSTSDESVQDTGVVKVTVTAPSLEVTLVPSITVVKPNDEVVFTATVVNRGSVPAVSTIITAPIPDSTVYKNGTITVDGDPKTDADDDDGVRFNSADNTVVVGPRTLEVGVPVVIKYTTVIE